jgi:aryl-alcohol dehydrogenase-like predicted oxidoreductase
MKLALGTVQFGLDYGVANTDGKMDATTMTSILQQAWAKGIDTLDTAISYGESEKRLGMTNVKDWRIVTKLPKIPNECTNINTWILNQVQKSLLRLGVIRISALLLHRPDQLLESNGVEIWKALQDLKQKNIVKKIGFSVNDCNQLDALWDSFQPNIVQMPYNLLDKRFLISGWMKKMNDAGVEIHVRSIFLQGLLLMSNSDRPEKFNRWKEIWEALDAWLLEYDITAVEAAISFAMDNPYIDKIVVGVDNVQQLEEILSIILKRKIVHPPKSLHTSDVRLINPSQWNSLS